jgi:hypothetical protein
MTNVLFWLLVTFVFLMGGMAGIALDTPKTQFICLCGAVVSLLIALRIDQKSG